MACFTTLFHFTGVFYKVNDAPQWRHILFVVINLFSIYGFLKRPRFFVFFFCALLVQQYYSHGSQLINVWLEKKEIHWISLFDLLLLPVVTLALIEDYKSKKTH